MKWAVLIKEIRDKTPGMVDTPEKCVALAKKMLLEKDSEFAKLHFASVLTQSDGQPLPQNSGGANDEIKRPVKEIKIGPQIWATAFRLMFGWGKEAVSGVIEVEGKHVASVGDPFLVYELNGIPRGRWVPFAPVHDMVMILWEEDGKQVRRQLSCYSTKEWTVGFLGSDMLEHRNFATNGSMVIRLTEPDEQFIEKWGVQMAKEAVRQAIDHLSLRQQNGGAGVAAAGEPGKKEEAANNNNN